MKGCEAHRSAAWAARLAHLRVFHSGWHGDQLSEPVEAAFGTSDQGEILVRMFAVLLRTVAQLDGVVTDRKRDAILKSLNRLATSCGLVQLSSDRIGFVASDTTRDSLGTESAVACICSTKDSASLLLVELFRVAACDGTLSDQELEWLRRFARRSSIADERFVTLQRRFGYGAFADGDAQSALRRFGVDHRATRETVASRYRDMSKELHPDKHPTLSDREKKPFAEQFRLATDDYLLLMKIFEAGQWCRSRGIATIVGATHGLVVDCFFCESAIRLPPEHGILATARCRQCNSRAVFPKLHAESLVKACATREQCPPAVKPAPQSTTCETDRRDQPHARGSVREPEITPGEGRSPAQVRKPGPSRAAIVVCVAIGFFLLAVTQSANPSRSQGGARKSTSAVAAQPAPVLPLPMPQVPETDDADTCSVIEPLPSGDQVIASEPRDVVNDRLESSMAQASSLRAARREHEGLHVLRETLAELKEVDEKNLAAWAQAQQMLRGFLRSIASREPSPATPTATTLRHEAAEVIGRTMAEYARHGLLDEAERQFALLVPEVNGDRAALVASVKKRGRSSKAGRYEHVVRLEDQAFLYEIRGVAFQDPGDAKKSLELSEQVVVFCRKAFGTNSGLTQAAKKNMDSRAAKFSGLRLALTFERRIR